MDEASLSRAMEHAVRLYQAANWVALDAFCTEVLKVHGDHVLALTLAGIGAQQCGRVSDATTHFARAVVIAPGDPATHVNYGNALAQLGRLEEALECFDKALHIRPEIAEVHVNRGAVLEKRNRLQEALESYDRALSLQPRLATAHNNRGNVLLGLARPADALHSYDRAIAAEPRFADAHVNRAEALSRLGRHAEALGFCEHALSLNPASPSAWNSRGVLLTKLSRLEEAQHSFERAVQLQPAHVEAWTNRGNVLTDLEKFAGAVESYDRALALSPEYLLAHVGRALALNGLGRCAEALGSCERALRIDAASGEAHCTKGIVLHQLGRPADALLSFDRALEVRPQSAQAHFNKGNTLKALGQRVAALESYDRALAIDARIATVHAYRGNVLQDLGDAREAIAGYDRALELDPDHPWLAGSRLNAKLRICDWTDLDLQIATIDSGISRGQQVSPPFCTIAVLDSPRRQREAAEIFLDSLRIGHEPSQPAAPASRSGRIHLAYYSADFYEHPTSFLAAGLFEAHDRDRFRVTAFSYGPDSADAMRRRLSGAFDEFLDVRGHSDAEVAAMSRTLGVDIAIDLKGFTQDARVGIFTRRAAPIQVSYLGYPGTVGSGVMDYIIADRCVIPAGSREHYAEKVVYMPGCYQVNDRQRPVGRGSPARVELGLPPSGFVFCCFNALYKLTPEVFDRWMRILRQVDDSVLWLLSEDADTIARLRQESQKRGVSGRRLIFGARLPFEDHLSRHQAADLFLDTLPCNAHTTASDAVWAGLPVLTLIGESFAGRVCASLLRTVGLDECITSSSEEYEALAVALARDPRRLDEMKQRLNAGRLKSPLFDTELFARNLEAAFERMMELNRAGSPPRDIELPRADAGIPQ